MKISAPNPYPAPGANQNGSQSPGRRPRRHSVMVCVSGLLRALVKLEVVGMLEYYVLAPLAREFHLHTVFCTNEPPTLAAKNAARHGLVTVRTQQASNMFQRRVCCKEMFNNITVNTKLGWVLSVRTDTIYFERVPDLSSFEPGIYMRARLWGPDKGITITRHHSWMSAWYANENPSVVCGQGRHMTVGPTHTIPRLHPMQLQPSLVRPST